MGVGFNDFISIEITRSKIIQRVPALRAFWDLEKTVLRKIRVSGTVLMDSLNAIFPH